MTSPAPNSPAATPGNMSGRLHQPIFQALPVKMGDYKLTHLLGTHQYSDFYVAKQSHVERRVVLEVLRPQPGKNQSLCEQQFLSHARARVAANPPHTVQVLDSSTSPEGFCYISQNLPQGVTLAAMAAQGKCLTGEQVCALILTAAELFNSCALTGLAAGPLKADMIFVNRRGEFSFLSPVLADAPAEGDSALQIHMLAAAILPVQPVNVPGQTRIATLLSWMLDGYEGQPLDWPELTNTAALVAEQLKPEAELSVNTHSDYDHEQALRASTRQKKHQLRRNLLIGAGVLTVITMAAIGYILGIDEPEIIPAVRGGYAYCKVNGKTQRVANRPVSIEEYHHFIHAYAGLDAGRQGSITQHIPPAESSPIPADWDAMLNAAQSGSEWQGRRLSMKSPVTNVTYWQALMYARYKRASLPEASLLAAVRDELKDPGVEEWTQGTTPATAFYSKCHIVLPSTVSDSPIPESDPTARTPQRGFRICH